MNSEILGDVVLKGAIDPASGNTLAIISNAETTIEGNLIAGSNTGITLSGDKVTFTDDATFADNSSLTFDELGDGAATMYKRGLASECHCLRLIIRRLITLSRSLKRIGCTIRSFMASKWAATAVLSKVQKSG